jgi:SAM-dependent methyltransferase
VAHPARLDYDTVAHQYDRRYAFQKYDGIRETVLGFLGSVPVDRVLEVGCGTGHWLALMAGHARIVAGVDLSMNMLGRARTTAPAAALVRASADQLPFADAAFDRIVCVNALHHFPSREHFFAEARRLLGPGGAVMTIGLDPHPERDRWWVYEFFPETLDVDRARFAPVRILRGEVAKAGFTWAQSFEADRIESDRPLREAFPHGLERGFTSQLGVIDDQAYARGLERLRTAGEDVPLVADLRFYATVGWVVG